MQLIDSSWQNHTAKTLFAFITRQPYCPRRLKMLCFSTPSLVAIKMGARLRVVKQSFFSLRGQYGCRVFSTNAPGQASRTTEAETYSGYRQKKRKEYRLFYFRTFFYGFELHYFRRSSFACTS